MNKELVVVSLFDGISCGLQALKNLGFTNIKYFASEIDKYAIKVSESNHPEIIRLGDVKTVSFSDGIIKSEKGEWFVGKVDLVLAGSPCQGFSFAGKQLNFDDSRSSLFFEFVRIWKECKKPNFLLENVKMKKEFEETITNILGTEPVKINSKYYTSQNRERMYWTNVKKSIKDRGQVDILTILEDQDFAGVWTWPRGYNKGGTKKTPVMPCITTSSWQHNFLVERKDGTRRKFTPVECERAQGLPNGYTSSVSDNQRYKVLGNCWTVPVIEDLLSELNLCPICEEGQTVQKIEDNLVFSLCSVCGSEFAGRTQLSINALQ